MISNQLGLASAWDTGTVTTVLVVDDEPRITRLVRDYLDRAGFRVLEAADGHAALATFHRHGPDLVVLDLGLPGVDGLDVIRELRATSDVPIIILSARSDETDRVVGLELGADDFVVKPFGPKELVARIRALLRRVATVRDGEVISVGDITVDVPKMRVTVEGREVDLTATEFQLVSAMIAQPGRVFTLVSCSRSYEVSVSSPTSGPLMHTSRTYAASSKAMAVTPGTSSPFTASATSSSRPP